MNDSTIIAWRIVVESLDGRQEKFTGELPDSITREIDSIIAESYDTEF